MLSVLISDDWLAGESSRVEAEGASEEVLRAREDPLAFNEYVLTNEETGEPVKNGPHHIAWHRHLDENQLALIIAPVEHGKTQSLSVGRVLWELGRDPTLRIGIYCDGQEAGKKIVGQIRRHIEKNERLHEVFPNLRQGFRGAVWTKTALEIERPTIAKDPSVQAMPAFCAPGPRWDLILIDDALTLESTRTKEQRDKFWEWLETSVFTRQTKRGRIWAIGTPWHKDDALHRMEANEDWKSMRLGAVENPQEPSNRWRPVWPEQWPIERLLKRQRGNSPHTFARKYLCVVASDETSKFERRWIDRCIFLGRQLTLAQRAPRYARSNRPIQCVTGVDLGAGDSEENAESCLFTIGIDTRGRFRLLDIQAGRWKGPELIARLRSVYQRFESDIFFETNGVQSLVADMLPDNLPLHAHYTGSNKWHEAFGVESITMEFSQERFIIPSKGGLHPEVATWIQEMFEFDPTAHTGDRLMACWIAVLGARKYAGEIAGSHDLGAR